MNHYQHQHHYNDNIHPHFLHNTDDDNSANDDNDVANYDYYSNDDYNEHYYCNDDYNDDVCEDVADDYADNDDSDYDDDDIDENVHVDL